MRLLPPLLVLLALAPGCVPVDEAGPLPEFGPAPRPPPTRMAAPERLIALGDLHGDHEAMMAALRLAEVVDQDGAWIGGETVVVQAGDQLDRGDSERRILDDLVRITDEAYAAGGAVVVLNGNHEAMNVELDLRYVSDGGFADFADLAPENADEDDLLSKYPVAERGRVAAFRPGGPYARLLAAQNTVAVVGDTVFVHGGVLPAHAAWGLENINAEVSAWMAGDGDEPTEIIAGDGPLWAREYSDGPGEGECALLDEALADLDAVRMVVAHTVQDEINVACFGRVWRVDVGMAAAYGGSPAVLEIRGDETRVID